MRHRRHHRRLNRTSAHRKAMHRNMAQSMIEHGSVRTTLPKAKDMRPIIEKIITLALRARNDKTPALKLAARRRLHRILSDRAIIPTEHQDAYDGLSSAKQRKTLTFASGRRHRTGLPKGKLDFTAGSVLHRLINVVAPKFDGRTGGYTRIVRLPMTRLGDQSPLAILQFVGGEEGPGSIAKPIKTARKRRNDARYAAAVKVLRDGTKARKGTEGAGAVKDADSSES